MALAGAGLSAWVLAGRKQDLARQSENEKFEQSLTREREINERIGGLLYRLNLPPESREPVALAEARAQALGLERDARALAEQEAQLREELAELASQVRDWGMEPGEELVAGLAQAREQCDRALGAAREMARFSREAQEESRRAEVLRAELGKLFDSAGLDGMEALTQARERAKKVAALTAGLEEVKKRLGTAGDAQQKIPDEGACEQRLAQAAAELNHIDEELRQLSQNQGRLEQALADLAQAVSPDQAQAHLQEIESQRLDLARGHDTLILGGELLHRAMEDFRLQAQPRLLKIAGDYLARATHGAYEWLGSDLFTSDRSKEPRLSARSGPGAGEHEAEVLSRGTRDQLYLCLRLALADEITQKGEPIPLILDDPLVNFDDARLASSLELFGELAQKRQIIFLTCHEEQAGLLQKTGPCRVSEI